ncbi:hypothetical protein QJS10_CPA03g01313 [Acorus calamus]|uniref:Uncharacterized protein n=1 Tax=Acorus calamus TaxID=4465 RepID=A0AAV9FCN8_ACOCL|nr:hypothetical protein QJS10_CPA03g01313 [Acorus calamus]
MPPRGLIRRRGRPRASVDSRPTGDEESTERSSAVGPGPAQEPPAWERAYARIADLLESQTRALEAQTRALAEQAREIQELRAAREAAPQVPLAADPPVVPELSLTRIRRRSSLRRDSSRRQRSRQTSCE